MGKSALAALAVLFALAFAPSAFADTYVVTKTADTNGVCIPGDCSLREAINAVNGGPNGVIQFNIGAGGPQTIEPTSPLPTITQSVYIDGKTQSLYDGVPLIRIDGSLAGLGADGLVATADTTVDALVIDDFAGSGVVLGPTGPHRVFRSVIGSPTLGGLGNGEHGIHVTADFTTIGGDGVFPTIGGGGASAGNTIQGNGRAVGAGVFVDASDVRIKRNLIRDNGWSATGVAVMSGARTQISENEIEDNLGLGIDLEGDGVTANDPGDGDVGPNDLQNFPVLTSATQTPDGIITVEGDLDSEPGGDTYRIEFFGSSACDGQGNGEGSEYLGTVTTTSSHPFAVNVSGLPLPAVVTATATDSEGNTSEFSACQTVTNAGTTFTVDTASDANLNDCNPLNPGDCSLRGALGNANGSAGLDTIAFSVGEGQETINVGSSLPAITDPVRISAVSQPGYDGVPLIELDFTDVSSGPGLDLQAGASTVEGFVLSDYPEAAVLIQGSTANDVSENYIGVGASGGVDQGGDIGIKILGSFSNMIGGTTSASGAVPGGGNVIGGNDIGLVIDTGAMSADNTVWDNRIGTNAAGSAAVPNATGIRISSQSGNLIGGGSEGMPNVISGNTAVGVIIVGVDSQNNLVAGNKIGTDAGGTLPLGNGGAGVLMRAGQNTVVGNVIGANQVGVELGVSGLNGQVSENFIGTDAGGTIDLGNATYGVYVHETQGAFINNNTIAFNDAAGVWVENEEPTTILTNSIHSNGGLGIDRGTLGPLGYTGAPDAPVLTSATSGDGDTNIAGTQMTTIDSPYEIEFFSSPTCDPSGHGEGKTYLGPTTVSGSGADEAFDVAFTGNVPTGHVITATATEASTSEFSQCVAVVSSTLTVNDTADSDDGACTAIGGPGSECTLREAINAANAMAGANDIHFDIPGSGPHTITPLSVLPTITDPVTIDGYTQPGASANTLAVGNNAVLQIEVNGNDGLFDGFVVTSGSTTIRGLVINNFRTDAIELRTSGVNTIEGNFIGTNTAGTALLTNGSGILIDGSSGNIIGGTAPGARNVIAVFSNGAIRTALATPGEPAGSNTIQGNYIGTNAAGTAAVGAGFILLSNPGNLVGGTSAGAGNVMSTVGAGGMQIFESDAHDNTVQGNFIGLNATGDATIGSGNVGINLTRASENVIGGTTAEARNVIASPSGGISMAGGTLNQIAGNYIGTNAAGTAVLPLGGGAGAGVLIDSAQDNTVGGPTASHRNVIAGSHTGVRILTQFPVASGNTIRNNYIGLNASGTAALPNLTAGVAIGATGGAPGPSDNNDVSDNVISGNGDEGIRLFGATNSDILRNFIGTAADGATLIGNQDTGILISDGSNNRIGDTEPGVGNVIAGNGPFFSVDGIAVFTGTGNSIRGNSLHSNAHLGIDLSNNGSTPNDLDDPDNGPNNLQNFPILTSATNTGADLEVAGTLNSTPSTAFDLDFYSQPSCGAGDDEAEAYLGSAQATTDTGGDASFDVSLAGEALAAGSGVSATATDPQGNTSEVSACQVVAGSQTFVVNTTADDAGSDCDPLGDPVLGPNCSLREAINAANGNPGPDEIHFDIAAGGSQTITPTSPLPSITGPTIVDGTTQGSFEGEPIIEVDGHLVEGASGLVLAGAGASGSTIRGLVINQFGDGAGVVVQGADSVAIQGNYIGTDSSGSEDLGNGFYGVWVSGGSGTAIGGTAADERNVVSGNVEGIRLTGGAGTNIQGNYIGTNAAGSGAVGNSNGIVVAGATGTVIGGTGAGTRNVISGNANDGMQLLNATTVQGNYIGTNAAGDADLGNGSRGIEVQAAGTQIGGSTPAARNVISGNQLHGVELVGVGATGNSVQGNYIGTNADGDAAIGNNGTANVSAGVLLEGGADANNIGGDSPGAGNVIAGSDVGVWVSNAIFTAVQGNMIGTNALGTAALPNTHGVVTTSAASDTVIGGNDPAERNVISGNDANGIHDDGSGTSIQGNYIGTNSAGGDDVANGGRGVEVTGSDTTIGGATDERNVISGNDFIGVHVHGAVNVEIAENYIGTNVSGEAALPNNGAGIQIEGTTEGVTVGGGDGGGNLISGNTQGIGVYGAGVTDVSIQGNFIGTDDDGEQAVANIVGVDLDLGADGVHVEDNLISGNQAGMEITGGADGTFVQGNKIGTNDDGTADLGNLGNGIYAGGVGQTLIGGLTAGDRNVISGNGTGVQLEGAVDGTDVQGNYIGTNAAGTAALGNSGDGVLLTGASNSDIHPVIGGTAAGARNVISGNFRGVHIDDSFGVDVRGNYIGTNAAGTAAVANQRGVEVQGTSWQNTIGGSAAGAGNVISGNANEGVRLTADGGEGGGQSLVANVIGIGADGTSDLGNGTGVHILDSPNNSVGLFEASPNVIGFNGTGIWVTGAASRSNEIEGNRIGTNGTADLGNDTQGIRIDGGATFNRVGGHVSQPNQNIISGNGAAGVQISGEGTEDNRVVGNLIGTTVSGNDPLSNAAGVTVAGGASGTVIGGRTAGERNVVSANGQGVRVLDASTGDTVIQNNYIGLAESGDEALGNNGSGIFIQNASDTLVGGTDTDAANWIAFNGAAAPEANASGVMVIGSGSGNSVLRNSIFDNGNEAGDLGIDLGGNGVTANDSGDPDSGPNELQNFPVIENVVVNESSIDLSGVLETEQWSGAPDGDTYTIEFFTNDTCDTAGNGEGENFLGSILVVEDDPEDFGPEAWETTLGGTLGEGDVVTATATSEDGSTSEFSECASPGAGAAEATITLESDQASVIAGAQTVPTGGIDLADLRRGGGTTQSTPLDSIPLDSIPLDSVPLDSIPLDSIGLTADLLNQALGGVHLSDIPISTPPGGWPEKLAGTALANVPLNTITLADVYRLNEASGAGPDPIPLDSIPLDSIDLSGTPLDSIGLGAIALGATPLDSIPLDSIGTNNEAENAADWCAALNPPTGGGPDPVPGYSCPPINPSTETLIGLAVRGVPLDSIPLDSIPLDSIPLDSIPLDSIPLDSIPLDSIPLDSIPLDSIPLDSIPLDSINFAVSPLDSIPLDSIGPGVIDCSGGYCAPPRDLGDADADGRIIPGTSLFDLMGALQPGNGASIADLIYGLPTPPRLTLGDLFALAIGGGQGTYDWSDLDLNSFPIALHSTDGGVITYHATFEVTGGAANPTATIHAALPGGGRYKPSSSQLREGESIVPIGEPQVGPGQLEWTRSIQRGVQYELTWQVHAPIELGNYAIGANVIVPGMESAALSGPVDVDVVQTLEPNDNPGAGAVLTDSTLYLGYMLPGDVDRHRIAIPTAFGSRVKVTLSHIAEGTDLDLAVAGPPSPRLRDAPANSIPIQNAQLPDSKVELDERTQPLPPETLQDVPTAAITTAPNVIRATSDNRGSADEEVNLISQGETGQYIVQVSDYEGDSPMPYMLEVEVEGPPNLGTCAARSFPPGQGVIGTMPTIPANVNTLILVNQQRLGQTYGNAAATNVMNSLNQLAGRGDLGIVGAVIPVDSSLAIRQAYAAWDGNPCSPEAANNVVEQIGQLIDGIEPDNLQYKVIVGGDDQIPFGRVADETLLANEQDYAASLSGPNNQYKGAFGHGMLMTDDVYAEEAAPEFLGHELFVPDQAIGRLVETPNEITGMISAFLAPGVNGAISAQRSLTTGYDFLTDGATAVNAPFTARFGAANARTLINETWPAKDANTSPTDDLEDALFPSSPTLPPQISAVNAHFDHTRLLPAAENAANRAANLYTSQDVLNRGANAVAQRILFSMGCHSGLATSDAVYGSTNPLSKDWAQTFLAGGAFAWIGNTGFGLGDTVDVAYTERLHALLSANLNGALPLGEALAQAKQQYLSTLGIVSGYDAKVLMQTTLYGLPMLDVGGGTAPATPPPAPLQTDAATGLQAASFNQAPTFTLVTRPDGKYYRAQTTQATNRRPIEPLVSFDVTQPGLIAHGVVITSLQSGADEANFDAAFSRIVTDKAEDEPELVGEASHPAKIQSIATFSHFASPATTRQNAVLIPGLYRSDGVPDPAGIGIHRLYTQIGGYVVYAPPSETDFTPPELGALDSLDIGNGSVGFGVDVTDADGLVKDVKVIYRDCAGVWRLATLQNSGGTRWSGGGPLAATCEQIDYYLQAVDDAGNVAVSSKKVQVEPLVLPAPTGDTDITISVAGTQHASGWYTTAVNVTLSANPASPLKYTLDGDLHDYTGPFSVTGNGLHIVEAFAEDNSTATEAFAIDTANPVVLMTTPPANATYTLGQVVKANYTCADSGSGIASCNPAAGSPANDANLNTSSLGMKTITVTATDMVGRTATLSRTYNVVLRSILFASTRTGNGDIYVVPPTGGTPVQLTTGNAIDAEPEWFPGNEKIAFSSSRTGSGDIYSLDIRTGVLDQLTSHPAIDTSPAVSPNGLKIAFASNRGSGGNWDIYVMNVDGSNVQRLTTNGTDDLLPAWSPDSQQIAFFSARSGQGDIYKMSATGANQTRLTSGSSGNSVDSEPAWFGSTIAFSTNRHGDNNFEIYTMTTTGASQTRRTQQAGHDITPSWSGDGAQLAFASNRPPGGGFNFNIWTMNANGSSQTAIVTHGAADVFPDW